MNTETIRCLADAVDAIRAAGRATGVGFADDHCRNAIREIINALHVEIGCDNVAPEEVGDDWSTGI